MIPLRLPAAAALLCLVGCGVPQDAAVAPAGTRAGVLEGRAGYAERIAPPPGARLRVQLIDVARADAADAVVAEHEQDAASGPPFAFSLPWRIAESASGRAHALHLELHDGEGNLWFVTPARVPVTLDAAAPAEVALTFAGGEPTAGGPDGTAIGPEP